VVECEQRVVDQIAEITSDVDAAELPAGGMRRKVLPASLRARAASIDRPAARAKAISRASGLRGRLPPGVVGEATATAKAAVADV
jgi:hypothetical protein